MQSLSDEQNKVIDMALQGYNLLVDACIGSGKTYTIQSLCNEIHDKKVLYLTYNKLLKLDARSKIKQKNVKVTNYHGFAWELCHRNNIKANQTDCIRKALDNHLIFPRYDILIIDEYQDIREDMAELLITLKEVNPSMQIIMVGDMSQKVYNYTALDVYAFIKDFLGDYVNLTFTKCFRLNERYAAMLGEAWNKDINGVNEACDVDVMSFDRTIEFLTEQDPKDILCLGSRTGEMANALNILELSCKDKYNKNTTYATIKDYDASVQPDPDKAIFTTYDSCKGLEKPICVIFNFDEPYWMMRSKKTDTNISILRNIFCVAASRGKQKIIFVEQKSKYGEKRVYNRLDITEFGTIPATTEENQDIEEHYAVSDMFDFKYQEDVDRCFNMVNVTKIPTKQSVINIKNRDGLIDLSPCLGIYQSAMFFKNYDIDKSLEYIKEHDKNAKHILESSNPHTTMQKILLLTSAETKQLRYIRQVNPKFVNAEDKKALKERLSLEFKRDEQVEIAVEKAVETTKGPLRINGRIDVLKDDIIWELKFKEAVGHTDVLQLATYLVLSDKKQGILWNTRNNTKFLVTVPDKKAFLKAVITAITKRKAMIKTSAEDEIPVKVKKAVNKPVKKSKTTTVISVKKKKPKTSNKRKVK